MRLCRRALRALAVLLVGFAAVTVGAQEYPSRPIRLVVPQGPGSGADVLSRMLADKLPQYLGQPVVVDNKPGANGIIASSLVMKEPPDGYTLLLTSVSLVSFNQYLYKNVPYDALKDFTYIAPVAEAGFVLVASNASGIKSWAELVTRAKAAPDTLTFASGGTGNSTHLYTEMIARRSGIVLRHIPYKGSGPALTSIIAGETDVMVSTIGVALPQILAGKMSALAVSGDIKSPQLPTVPLLKELSPDVPPLPGWYALAGPAHLDAKIVERLVAAVNQFLADPAIRAKLILQYLTPIPGTAAGIQKRGESEAALWGGFIRELKIEPE